MADINIYIFMTALSYILLVVLMMYLFMPKKFNYNYKKNLIVFFAGMILMGVAIYWASISNDINVIFLIGSFLFAPYMGYFLGAVKNFTNKFKR